MGNSNFGIGDTISTDPKIIYDEIPKFAPEHFVFIHNPNPSDFKKFRDGLDQLLQEGVIQVFYLKNAGQRIPLLGAVGPLQFEVAQFRLESEYGAKSRLEQTSWKLMRWLNPDIDSEKQLTILLPAGAAYAFDSAERTVILFTSEWSLNYFKEKNPDIELSDNPFHSDVTLSAK